MTPCLDAQNDAAPHMTGLCIEKNDPKGGSDRVDSRYNFWKKTFQGIFGGLWFVDSVADLLPDPLWVILEHRSDHRRTGPRTLDDDGILKDQLPTVLVMITIGLYQTG